MKKKEIKARPGGSEEERATKPRHGGNLQGIQADWYAAKQAGVDPGERDTRAVGMGPGGDEEPEPDRGKEFSGPGRRRDPDDVR